MDFYKVREWNDKLSNSPKFLYTIGGAIIAVNSLNYLISRDFGYLDIASSVIGLYSISQARHKQKMRKKYGKDYNTLDNIVS